jgi:hypothetical protein
MRDETAAGYLSGRGQGIGLMARLVDIMQRADKNTATAMLTLVLLPNGHAVDAAA